jgi:hypothetical protein
VYRAVAQPETLMVEGPETKISAVSRLSTDAIHVETRTEPFTARVGAIPDGGELRVVDPRPLDVIVYIDLTPVTATIDRVPVVAAGVSDGVVIVPSTISVTVSAPSALVPKLRTGHLRAIADVNGSAGSTFVAGAPLRVELTGLDPEERAKVTVIGMSRKKVDVRRSAR